jgi:hypothetical protein
VEQRPEAAIFEIKDEFRSYMESNKLRKVNVMILAE